MTICTNVCGVLGGESRQFCHECACSMSNCDAPRGHSSRFCAKHFRTYENLSKGSYMNQYGEQKFDKAWSRELTMVAKHGWMLSGMCPCDVEAFSASADWLVGTRTTLSGRDLLHFYIAAFLKLPHAVEAWRPWMREPGVSVVTEGRPAETSSPETAAEFASCSYKLAGALCGVQACWEHEQLSTGQQNLLLGPHAFFKMMGMLAES